MAVNATIASRIAIRRRYVRSVDLARDVDDPEALDGYVVTSSVREAATRVLAGLSAESRQRAFRVVGPYGAGKSAFGVFLAQLLRDRGSGHAMELLAEATGSSAEVTPWRPIIVSGRRVSFTRELLRVVSGQCGAIGGAAFADLRAKAKQMLQQDGVLDVLGVTSLLTAMAAETRLRTGDGLLLLVDEMGRFLEYAAANMGNEDPSIFQAVAEISGGRAGANVAIVGFLHHRFVDYVAGMGGWIEAEWSRSSERYEELPLDGSTEQSLFMLAHAIEPTSGHSPAVRRQAKRLYGEAVDRGVFAVPRQEVAQVAPDLYPLHPAAVSMLAWAIRRFGQNERSLFSFLQSLEPASVRRFAHSDRVRRHQLVPCSVGVRPLGVNHARQPRRGSCAPMVLGFRCSRCRRRSGGRLPESAQDRSVDRDSRTSSRTRSQRRGRRMVLVSRRSARSDDPRRTCEAKHDLPSAVSRRLQSLVQFKRRSLALAGRSQNEDPGTGADRRHLRPF